MNKSSPLVPITAGASASASKSGPVPVNPLAQDHNQQQPLQEQGLAPSQPKLEEPQAPSAGAPHIFRTPDTPAREHASSAPPLPLLEHLHRPHSHNGHLQAMPKPAPHQPGKHGVGAALTDTPLPSLENSPKISPARHGSVASTPRIRPTTLDIPGLTKSKVSPDGKIAQRDVGAKLLIVMVGLPARGKSYIVKKLSRYLNFLQHNTKVFNVGERRRIVAGGGSHQKHNQPAGHGMDRPHLAAEMLMNGKSSDGIPDLRLPEAVREDQNVRQEEERQHRDQPRVEHDPDREHDHDITDEEHARLEAKFPHISADNQSPDGPGKMDQSASFFDPKNRKAALIREQVALETLHECLDYILLQGGSVGILDATNSTLERRRMVMREVRERAGELNVLFIESVCVDETLLEANMRLKLSGPDYKHKDPVAALADFKERVKLYEQKYVPLGDYEEQHNMPYVKMIDVGRKVVSHQIRGFLSSTAVYYLLNFNLAPRQVWITRHGESYDNARGRIGGDAELTPNGIRYADALTRFIAHERGEWEVRQAAKQRALKQPVEAGRDGSHTPPNPHYLHYGADEDGEGGMAALQEKNFCVWSSMLKRGVQCAERFDEDKYEVKQIRLLDELNAGKMEGLTYDEIRERFPDEFAARKRDKLQYRYPGQGGESYLDVINRLRPLILEIERTEEHLLVVTHRAVARVLLAYFRGLKREEIADLECPLGMLYMLEPKPYGVEYKAYRYNPETDWFDVQPT
ncbi:6-phosphofructo-2-kinase-domain-containing protein [Lineolata rhizophorae]|uniref:6-phosphofructo-2-kinase-domain-containing protein n=1 Tax=Lineolata rhizophorae TaxID=578093 RepID=A0A6A6NSI3_9PEZI|nr:6-phosphofructo-2-kinase-domain-containing protein [Lineolata rhizophorae]